MYSLYEQYPCTKNEAFPNSSTKILMRIPNLNDINPKQTKKYEIDCCLASSPQRCRVESLKLKPNGGLPIQDENIASHGEIGCVQIQGFIVTDLVKKKKKTLKKYDHTGSFQCLNGVFQTCISNAVIPNAFMVKVSTKEFVYIYRVRQFQLK